ncbi:unnamed protein product [Protopolystoma xenopodis]|uniref:Uncharacterized protein n=1 Tax=Protopolystoma xenopodis TaxID=117903 RepID=A0A3S5B1W3_9PLAT|nr:unnamed protein product [Protopolystoma xenopodis]
MHNSRALLGFQSGGNTNSPKPTASATHSVLSDGLPQPQSQLASSTNSCFESSHVSAEMTHLSVGSGHFRIPIDRDLSQLRWRQQHEPIGQNPPSFACMNRPVPTRPVERGYRDLLSALAAGIHLVRLNHNPQQLSAPYTSFTSSTLSVV